ncbi:unnamed protein product [Symbiodinium sp. CCMP2592]|nr:unnamed protein product [Symbiodinium sp. CCMP2592]
MGKRGGKWKQGDEQEWTDGEWAQPAWRLWRGGAAVSPKATARPPWHRDGQRPHAPTRALAFPHYDAKKAPEAAIVPVAEKKAPGLAAAPATAPSLVKVIQAAVNTARKHENRVGRLQKELDNGKLQWDAYVQEMKDTLRKEKARFVQEQNRLTAAVQDAKDQQTEAYAQLQQAFLTGTRPQAKADKGIAEDLAEWNEVMTGMEEAQSSTGGVNIAALVDALKQAGIPMPGLEDPSGKAPTTPPRRPPEMPATTPPASPRTAAPSRLSAEAATTPSPTRTKDPYMSSPSLAHFGIPSPRPAPVETPSTGTTGQKNQESEASTTGGPMGSCENSPTPLAERLAAKRKVTRAAMAPFGVARGEGPFGPAGEPKEDARTKGTELDTITLDVDDSEELLSSASPGLGKLE